MRNNFINLILSIFIIYNQSFADIIDELYNLAKRNNPSILAGQYYIQSAKHMEEYAKWQFFPTFNFSGGVPFYDTKNIYNKDIYVTAKIQSPLFTGGRLKSEYNKSKQEVYLAEYTLKERQFEILIEITKTYYEWLSTHKKIEAYSKSLKKHDELKELVENRIRVGISPESDIYIVKTRVEQINSEITNLKIKKEFLKSKLSQIVGINLEDEYLLKSPESVNVSMHLDEIYETAFRTNPTIKKFEIQSQISKKNIEIKKSALYPDIYLNLEYQRDKVFSKNNNDLLRVYLSTNSKLGAGLSSLTDINIEIEKYNASLKEIEAQKLKIKQIILDYYSRLMYSESLINKLSDSFIILDLMVGSWQRQFLAGKRSWVDLLNGVRELLDIEVKLIEAEFDKQLAERLIYYYTNFDS